MNSITRDMVEGYKDIAMQIQEFLWKGKPYKSDKIDRSKEELEDFLEGVREDCLSNHNSGASYMS